MVEKKKFFEVELPLINDKAELLAYSAESLNGKTIKIDLTRRLRGKSLEAVFKISFDNGLKAKMTRISLFGYFIRRMMRKSISYIEDSFFVECKNAVLRIKPYMLTRQKVSRKVINGKEKSKRRNSE